MRVLLLLAILCLWLAPTTVLAQESEDPTARINTLVESFQKARKEEAKREILAKLVAIGEPAFVAVETSAAKRKAEAADARKAAGDDPDPATLERLRKQDSAARSSAKVRDGVYMAVVAAAFQAIEKKHKNLNLIFAGQFNGLKRYGKRAVRGSILLMKDLDIYQNAYRYKAWEVLADLGDKSVLAQLKEMSTDYLMEDEIREGAVCARSALGDTSGIDKKIRELEAEGRDQPNRQIEIARRIASLYHHGRQYGKAAGTYDRLIAVFEGILTERADELQKAQVEGIKGTIANFAYNGACALSLAKNYPATYAMLARCLKNEKDPANYIENILRDGDLANVRGDPHFKAWFSDAKEGKFPKRPPGAPAPPNGEKPDGEKEPGAEKPKAGTPDEKSAGGEAVPSEKPGGKTGAETPPPPEGGGKADRDQDTPNADPAAAERLMDAYLAADPEQRPRILTRLHALGPIAVTRLVARKTAEPENRALARMDKALCAELVRAEMRNIEKVDPEGTLTYAGQFNGLKKHGKRAVRGAMALLSDKDAVMQHRRWAADALGDLGDRSVVPELKAMTEDFLWGDEVQEAAAFAMAALGDTSMLDRKIDAHREAFEKGSLIAYLDVARIQYRGRAYDKAVVLLRVVTREIEGRIASHGDEMEDKQKATLRSVLASTYYSLACNLALQGQVEPAFAALDKCLAVDDESQFLAGIRRDGDLRTLRQEVRFANWHADWTKRKATPPTDKPEPEAESSDPPSPAPAPPAPADTHV